MATPNPNPNPNPMKRDPPGAPRSLRREGGGDVAAGARRDPRDHEALRRLPPRAHSQLEAVDHGAHRHRRQVQGPRRRDRQRYLGSYRQGSSGTKIVPSWYILDSIMKNVGDQYRLYFAGRLDKIFVDTYKKLSPSLCPAMVHLFRTWGKYIPSFACDSIEDFVQKNHTPASSGDLRHSGSHSPHLLHGHVNAKYLEAHHQMEHSTVVMNKDCSRSVSSTSHSKVLGAPRCLVCTAK